MHSCQVDFINKATEGLTTPLMIDFSQRNCEPELMDSPESSGQLMHNTYLQFSSINRLLTPCRRALRKHMLKLMSTDRTRNWSLLDIGAGGCDLAIWLIETCRKEQISLDITCIDQDSRAIAFASPRLASYPEIKLIKGDALELLKEAPQANWDFVFSNHFLHHLSNIEIAICLEQVVRVCREQCVMSDLVRSRLWYILYSLYAGVFLRNSFCYEDGRHSIHKSLTIIEASRLIAEHPSLSGLSVKPSFPGHLVFLLR